MNKRSRTINFFVILLILIFIVPAKAKMDIKKPFQEKRLEKIENRLAFKIKKIHKKVKRFYKKILHWKDWLRWSLMVLGIVLGIVVFTYFEGLLSIIGLLLAIGMFLWLVGEVVFIWLFTGFLGLH